MLPQIFCSYEQCHMSLLSLWTNICSDVHTCILGECIPVEYIELNLLVQMICAILGICFRATPDCAQGFSWLWAQRSLRGATLQGSIPGQKAKPFPQSYFSSSWDVQFKCELSVNYSPKSLNLFGGSNKAKGLFSGTVLKIHLGDIPSTAQEGLEPTPSNTLPSCVKVTNITSGGAHGTLQGWGWNSGPLHTRHVPQSLSYPVPSLGKVFWPIMLAHFKGVAHIIILFSKYGRLWRVSLLMGQPHTMFISLPSVSQRVHFPLPSS